MKLRCTCCGKTDHHVSGCWIPKQFRHTLKKLNRLLQVRKGTRVRCPYCDGKRGGCQMCEDHAGMMSRDSAIFYLNCDLEVLVK